MNSPAPGASPTVPPVYHATVESIDYPHPDIRILRLRVGDVAPLWLAGQFMEISFAGFPARPYSIASIPDEDVLEFHIRNNHRGGASEFAVTALKIGDILTLRGPFGSASLRDTDFHAPRVIMLAGGMGISPLRAIIRDALSRSPTMPITLYWGVQTEHDLYIADQFDVLAARHAHFDFIRVIADRGDGHVHDAALAHESSITPNMVVYLSGPAAMIAAALPAILNAGASAENIRGDDPHISALNSGGSAPAP